MHHFGYSDGLSLAVSSDTCPEWPLLMESGLAFQTNYRLLFHHTNGTYMNTDSDRFAVRRALESIHVDGAQFVSHVELASQQRLRVLIADQGLRELELIQDIGQVGKVIWRGIGSPNLSCGMSARVEYDVSCQHEQVVAIGHIAIPTPSAWSGSVDIGNVFSVMKHSLSFSGVVIDAEVQSVGSITFDGLVIDDKPVQVVLHSSSESTEVFFSVPGNSVSHSRRQIIARSVWEHMVEKLLDEGAQEQCLEKPTTTALQRVHV